MGRGGPAAGPGTGERAGRVAVVAVAAAAAVGSARSGRGARTAGGHARSRRASHPRLGGRGRCCAGSGSSRAPASGRGARSRLGRRARPRVTGPGRRAGPPAGMRSCGAKKGPDVTCSQSARAARGQVTSAGAGLWVQIRGGGRGGRGPGLDAAALRPLPSPRTRAPALKGTARGPDACPGSPPPGSLPCPSALPLPGPAASPHTASRRVPPTVRRARVLCPPDGPELVPAPRPARPAPRSLCSCGACRPESLG